MYKKIILATLNYTTRAMLYCKGVAFVARIIARAYTRHTVGIDKKSFVALSVHIYKPSTPTRFYSPPPQRMLYIQATLLELAHLALPPFALPFTSSPPSSAPFIRPPPPPPPPLSRFLHSACSYRFTCRCTRSISSRTSARRLSKKLAHTYTHRLYTKGAAGGIFPARCIRAERLRGRS